MVLARSFLQSVGLDQVRLLQRLLLLGTHDQRSLMPGLKRAAPLQEQADRRAVPAGLDLYRDGHGFPPPSGHWSKGHFRIARLGNRRHREREARGISLNEI